MIKIKVDKNKISVAEISAINKFEESLLEITKRILQQDSFLSLRVLPNFVLEERKSAPIKFINDAAFSKKNSFELVNIIRSWIEGYNELEVYIPKYTLVVDFKISVVESPQNDKKYSEEAFPIFTPSKPKHTFEKVVIPDQVRNRIMADLQAITKMDLVYKEWGFEDIDGTPRLVLSFYGKPGTGKTMIAHAIADHFKKPLLALNYSEIESKYVGDAAKNLKHAFDTAKEFDAVLFFDESDSFLGKRIQNVSQGSEQAINSLRSQMLMLLEEYSGIVLFATNLAANYDKAFESRFLDSIEIPMPDQKGRSALIKCMIPKKLPLKNTFSDDDFMAASALVEGLAGREIKNAIFKMLLKYADDDKHLFSVEDLFEALKDKMKELDDLHKEIDRQNGIKKLNATPQQLVAVKDVIKSSEDEMKTVKIDN